MAGTPPAPTTTAAAPAPAGHARETYILFLADVNATTTESLLGVMADEVKKGTTHVYLLLSTPGGQVMQGIALYNALLAMPFELVTHNIGNVDSIGNAVFLAGAKRVACSNSTFMFHGVGFQTQTQQHFQEAQLRERLSSILADQKRIGDIIKSRTSLTDTEIADLFLHEQTKDVTYASSKGIIHQVTPVQIPAGAAVIQLIFKR